MNVSQRPGMGRKHSINRNEAGSFPTRNCKISQTMQRARSKDLQVCESAILLYVTLMPDRKLKHALSGSAFCQFQHAIQIKAGFKMIGQFIKGRINTGLKMRHSVRLT